MKPKILFLEDSDDLGLVMKQLLEINGFAVEWCSRADTALQLIDHTPSVFDLLIIDIELPDLDGFTFTERVRERINGIPFLYLTARSEKDDRIRGLKYGAVDYITKPFDVEELLLRVKNSIYRPQWRTQASTSKVRLGDLVYCPDELAVVIGTGVREILTKRESEVLEYLIRNANRLVRKDEMLKALWGEVDYFKGRSLDTYIGRLKKILGASKEIRIENRYGVGWSLNVVSNKEAGPYFLFSGAGRSDR